MRTGVGVRRNLRGRHIRDCSSISPVRRLSLGAEYRVEEYRVEERLWAAVGLPAAAAAVVLPAAAAAVVLAAAAAAAPQQRVVRDYRAGCCRPPPETCRFAE